MTALDLTDTTTLTVTGTDFFTADYDATFTLAGIEADSVSIDSTTSLTANFDNGVPAGDDLAITLWF